MADTNDNNEGYEFPELDDYSPEVYETGQPNSEPTSSQRRALGFSASNINPVWRKAIIVLTVVVVLMLGYKYFGNFFRSDEKGSSQITSVPKKPSVQAPKEQAKIVQQPSKPQLQVQPQPDNTEIKQVRQNLAKLELSQRSINTNINEIESKLNGLDGSVVGLSGKLADITQQLAVIVDKMDSQANVINVLRARLTPKKPPKLPRILPPPIQYSIQAIIPGRAWLIGSNGSTITVSKGSRIANYGIVRLIDAQLGRVVTSSGKVIKFEPEIF